MSAQWRLAAVLQLGIKGGPLLPEDLWLDKVEIKETFDSVEVPFGFARFHLYNFSARLALDRVRSEVADGANSVKGFSEMSGQPAIV